MAVTSGKGKKMTDESISMAPILGYQEYMMHIGEIAVAFENLKENMNHSIAMLLNPNWPSLGMFAAKASRSIPEKNETSP